MTGGPESTHGEPALPVSVIILTKNEARVIERTLASASSFDEVFVVDSGSDDATAILARAAGAVVINFSWDGDYPKKKEWALLNLPIRNSWVLYLDADEIISRDLCHEIKMAITEAAHDLDAFDVELDYHFLGRRLSHGHRVTKRVLLRTSVVKWPRIDDLSVNNMWEVEGHYQPEVPGKIGKLRNRLGHEDLDPLYDWFARHNRYSDWEAHLAANPKTAHEVMSHRSAQGQRFARVPLRPLAFFIYSFFAKNGWRDGRAGFHYAVAQAFYLWQVHVKTTEIARGAR